MGDAGYLLSYVSLAPVLVMILTFVFCLSCSAIFHLFNAKSENWNKVLARLDYGGIAFAIFGGNLPIIYYGFACNDIHYERYILISVMGFLCFGSFITTLIDKFE